MNEQDFDRPQSPGDPPSADPAKDRARQRLQAVMRQSHREEPLDNPDDSEPISAVDEVCDRIEMLDTLLAAVVSSGDIPAQPATYLSIARQLLWDLRDGLAGRRLDRPQATSLINRVDHGLRETDQILCYQHGLSLEAALHQRIGELIEIGGDLTHHLQVLARQVERLFDAADEPTPSVPVP